MIIKISNLREIYFRDQNWSNNYYSLYACKRNIQAKPCNIYKGILNECSMPEPNLGLPSES